MLVIRPIKINDCDALYELSALASAGLTTLPHDREVLQRKIKQSEKSFDDMPDRPGNEVYLFAAEDTNKKKIIGTCAIYAKVGGFEPFYTYKIETMINESKVLNVRKEIQYLKLIKDHNGPTEIGTLFLDPEYRKSGNGKLLSLSRFLFMAQYPRCFEKTVIAEMRGVIDQNDRSPFWEALGKHFFAMEFKNADMMVLRDKSFIADLMPQNPIYIQLLPREAQDVIGKVHDDSEAALHLLQQEGFRYRDEIDIFEAGPVVRTDLSNIKTVRESKEAKVETIDEKTSRSSHPHPQYLVANVDAFEKFRVVFTDVKESPNGVTISSRAARHLHVKPGSRVRFIKLRGAEKKL